VERPDLTRAHWFKSSRSSENGQCTEVAFVDGAVAVRDSKDPHGPALIFTPNEWTALSRGPKMVSSTWADTAFLCRTRTCGIKRGRLP
jgi:hypothetical protein